MNHNKQSIERNIKALEEAVNMEANIRKVLEQFKHYKQVNVKFIDALKERGYYAYIARDKWSITLKVSPINKDIAPVDIQEFRVYVSNFMNKEPLTWDRIEKELVRHNFQGRLKHAYEMLDLFDKEKQDLEDLYNHVNTFSFTCFDMYKIKRELEDALDYANKE